VITVLDTGTGISKKDQKKLFKMFGCLQSTQQMNTQGIGLGLFICKQIVEQFEGDIFVKSQEGVGTRFTYSFLLDQSLESL
jgi:signal transduction histidine kinase